MDPQNNQSPCLHPQELRQVLVLQPPYIFKIHEHLFTDRFQVLKEYESPLPTRDFLHAHAQFVKVVLCSGTGPITAEVIRDLLALKLVVTDATGVNHIDMAECGRRGITITNAGDVYSDDIADAAVGLLIDVMRRITSGERFVRDGCWTTSRVYPLGAKVCSLRTTSAGICRRRGGPNVCSARRRGFFVDLGVSIWGVLFDLVAEQGWEVVAEWRWAAEVKVVAGEVVSGGRRGEGEKRLEDICQCLCQEEVSQTFFNERSARKQTICGLQTSARVCAAQT
ncbi:putative oxidoreductase [Helianthus annuus]|uniref:Oxidoreductase n=1 Tax=Helianthus annuus TaxID=4232 RepID=A0A9K3JA56_HELAN|nr:putative oxidoreductase [Helianthus annuus]KAJ0598301.1 putative oxidoreductase [Helianthus annuus]KAJ0928455.1 putative oxidoreductase [Helianthus annuus]